MQLLLLHCPLKAVAVPRRSPNCFGIAGLVLAAYHAAAPLVVIDLVAYTMSERHT